MLRTSVAVLLGVAGASALAADYPNRPIRMVVAYAPGGTTDFTARVVAPQLGELLGQTVVVDNRPGAGSLIGTEVVARATPDGHTLLLADTTFGIVPAIYAKLPYDAERGFIPVSQIVSVANCLTVHPGVAAKSVKELVAAAKARPGKLTFGSGGVGTPLHMAGEQLKVAAGIDMTHVAYKGAAPAVTDLLGGQITLVFPTLTLARPHVAAGRLRALAVTSAKRSPALPDAPTMAEAGFPSVDATSWFGLVAPAGTPQAVVDRLHAELVKVLAMPDVRKRFSAQYAEVVASSPAEYAGFIRGEIANWTKIAKAGNIRAR